MPKKQKRPLQKSLNSYDKLGLFIKRYSFLISSIAVVMSLFAGVIGIFQDINQRAQAVVGSEDVQITGITQDGDDYLVAFVTTDYTNTLNDVHTHFYYDTENNDVANKLYFGDSPYVLAIGDTPQGATQICAIVSQANLTPVQGTGNCFALPAAVTPSMSLSTPSESNGTVSVPFNTTAFSNIQGGYHTNFYFDNEGAGSASSYYGGSPYTFNVSTIPQGATQICGIVQNDSETVQNSGNCVALPASTSINPIVTVDTILVNDNEVTVSFTTQDFVPAPEDYRLSFSRTIIAGEPTNTPNISSEEFSSVSPYIFTSPIDLNQTVTVGNSINTYYSIQICASVVDPSGSVLSSTQDCETVEASSSEVPQTPDPAASITNISKSGESIIIDFVTSNFTNSVQGPFTRFYFDSESNIVSSNDFTGSSPYAIEINSIPGNATALCVVVIDSGNAIVDNSGNCLDLPELSSSSTQPKSNITSVVVNGTNLEVSFQTVEFSNDGGYEYTRFYFDTETVNQSTKDFTQLSPYTLPTSNVPASATQICSAVIDTTGSALANSGNCVNLPAINNSTDPGDNSGGDTESGGNTNTGGGNATTAPFLLNQTTQRLAANIAPSKISYEVGEALQFSVSGIQNSDGTPASNVSCRFTVIFTPISTGIAQSLIVDKQTNSQGDCSLSISSDGTIATLPWIINTQAQSANVGATTELFDEDGTGSVQVSVTGSDNQQYFTDSASFTVGDISGGNLARTGGISLGISLLGAIAVILMIAKTSQTSLDTNKTKVS